MVQQVRKCIKRKHHDFLRVNFSLGTDDSPSSATSEAVKGGLVASGDGTAAAKPNWVWARMEDGPGVLAVKSEPC